MRRDLGSCHQAAIDLLIVGGGITGLAIAYDAAQRGLSVVLADKGDFGAATSMSTSKLIHGGLRYLKQLQFGVVRESLREREIFLKIAPQLVEPLPFIIPDYEWSSTPGLVLWAGLMAYDLLSFDKSLPRNRRLSVGEVLEKEPGVKRNGLMGGYLYYDAFVPALERLNMAFAHSAYQSGAKLFNHTEVVHLQALNGKIEEAWLKDRIFGHEVVVKPRLTVNAAGPWADQLAAKVLPHPEVSLARSKGIHLVVPPIHRSHALTLQTTDGRHLFLLPFNGHTLIGTTDTPFQGDPDQLKVEWSDCQALLDDVNETYGTGQLSMADVLHTYAGIRPLVKGASDNTYTASRRHEIIDHEREGVSGFYTVIGGKYTTSRALAEEMVDRLFGDLGQTPPRCRTATTILQSSDDQDRLAIRYGQRADEVRDLFVPAIGGTQELVPGVWSAEVLYAARHEMAMTLSDVLVRRTDLASAGHPGSQVVEAVADLMAQELGWSSDQRIREVRQFEAKMRLPTG